MGALPLFCSGEPGLDVVIEAETTEALSLIISLAGVSGRWAEAIVLVAIGVAGEIVAGGSGLTTGITRSVFGVCFCDGVAGGIGIEFERVVVLAGSLSGKLTGVPSEPFVVEVVLVAFSLDFANLAIGNTGIVTLTCLVLLVSGVPRAGKSSSKSVGAAGCCADCESRLCIGEDGVSELKDGLWANPGGGRETTSESVELEGCCNCDWLLVMDK